MRPDGPVGAVTVGDQLAGTVRVVRVAACAVVAVAVVWAVGAHGQVDRPAASSAFTIAERAADGSPVRWCASVHVVVNPAGGPPDALAAVDGATAAAPTAAWPQVGRPVLVAWGPPGTGPLGAAGESGATTRAWVGDRYVSALVVHNSEHVNLMRSGYGADRTVALLEHELGHVLGLGHVDDPTQVMFDQVGSVGSLGAGDRAGLAAIGKAGDCGG
jgi:hypothetical protein